MSNLLIRSHPYKCVQPRSDQSVTQGPGKVNVTVGD